MKKWLSKIFRRWGTTLTVQVEGEDMSIRGVFQPVTSVGKQSVLRQWMDLGQYSAHQYLYVGGFPLGEADFLSLGGKNFLPLRCEPIYLENEILCYWALCAPIGEE
ncbi:MAG: hypothetical protein J6K84_00505 [Oscillospiraceae bacterium]|nr:hypothetical protein [Oscillospiraceae bacterium]